MVLMVAGVVDVRPVATFAFKAAARPAVLPVPNIKNALAPPPLKVE